MSSRFRKSVLAVMSLALVLGMMGTTGCTTGGDSTETSGEDVQKGGTFVYYINNPAYIDPINVQESEGIQVAQAVFDSLITFDPVTSEIKPAAAESWEPNEDGSVWTFKLAQDAKFHDGTPVTANDFKYAWERICNPANGSEIAYHIAVVKGFDEMQAGTATELSGVRVVDDHTLEVTLNYAFSDFINVVGHPAFAPVPKAAVEADSDAFGLMPIGNGPFKMTEPWKADQYIKVEKFAEYYGEEPNIDGVEFRIFSDQDTAFLEFEAGNVDFTEIPTGQIESSVEKYGESEDGYSVEPGHQVALGGELATYFLVANNTAPPFDNEALRQAVSLAINRQAICDKVFEGTRIPASGIAPAGMPGFQENAWAYSKYDVEAAKAKLEEAGFPNGEGAPEIVINYNTGSGHEDILALVKADLEAVGLTATLEGMEWAQYLDVLDAKDYQIGRLGWLGDYPIIDNFLYPLFESSATDNYTGYSNADVDQKLQEARKTTDSAARIQMYQEVEATVGEASPLIPLMFYRHHHVASNRVHDGVYSPLGLFNFESVWLSQDTEG